MKRNIISMMAVLAVSGAATAQTLRVPDVEALPGEEVEYALILDVQGGDHKGFQYEMQFPATGFTLVEADVPSSASWNGGSFAVGDLDATGWARGSASSTSDTSIPDGEMVIGTVKFTVDEGVALGDYDVTITGFDLLDGVNYVHVNGGEPVTFKIHVVSIHTIILDENSTEAPVASGAPVNIRVLRTIKANEWSTICLPFAMTAEQMTEAFGDGVELADFKGYDATEDADGNIVGIKVNFETATAIEANHPYIIKVSAPVSEFSADGVEIDPEEDPTVAAVRRTKKQWSEMTGTYAAGTVLEAQTLFLSGNKFWYSAGHTTMKAYRAYFDFYDVLTEVEDEYGVKIAINLDGIATEVGGMTNRGMTNDALGFAASLCEEWYDLSGRKLSGKAARPQQRGIYVSRGKKVAAK